MFCYYKMLLHSEHNKYYNKILQSSTRFELIYILSAETEFPVTNQNLFVKFNRRSGQCLSNVYPIV